MQALYKVFDLISGAFSSIWATLQNLYGMVMAVFDSFSSWFDDLFSNLGIYDTIASSLDTVSSLANQLAQYVGGDSLSSTIASFVACDTLFTVVVTSLTATVGVLLAALSLVLVTTVPVLLGWLAVKGVLRIIRVCTAGIAKP
jgi:hypothetical protein